MQSRIYSEIYEFLKIMGEDYINKIPQELYYRISENKDENYILKYKKDIPIYEQELDKKTVALLCMLHYNYWCESEEEKKQIEKILKYNQKLKTENYNKYRDRFKKKDIVVEKADNQLIQIIQIKPSIIEIIKKYLKHLLRKVKFL